MKNNLDLTVLSTTFPDPPDHQVSRDNLVRLLLDRFGPDRKVIVVQGQVGSGKTVLLTQFARTYPNRCLSFFIGTTLPNSQPRYFLLDMCEQMSVLLGRTKERLDQFDTDRLKQVYLDLYRKLVQHSRKTDSTFFFVVDGIEWVQRESQETTILDLLPGEPRSNIRVLISSDRGRTLLFTHDKWDIIPFSLRDTETYLDGLNLSKDDVQGIHNSSQGVPGYLAVVRRLLASGTRMGELPTQLPGELRGMFQIEWDRTDLRNEDLVQAVAILAYSREPLTLDILSEIGGINEESIRSLADDVSFLRLNPSNETIGFISDAYKQFASDRLAVKREQAERLLVSYYGQDPYAKNSLVLLPTYLAKANRYDNLKGLVTTDYLARALEETRDLSLLRRTLRLTADKAHQAEDWLSLLGYVLSGSIIKSLSTRPIAEAEVEALLKLGDHQQAFEIAYRALLTEDRLQLLARVCNRMQQRSLSVPEDVIAELEHMAASLDPDTPEERVTEIAAVLFDLLPEAAIALVERGAGRESQRSLDAARAALALRLETDSTDFLKSRIADQTLRDFVRVNSPRVGALSTEEVLAEVEKVRSTSGKLYLLTAWCNANRSNSDAILVVEKALEIVTGDPTYATSMRLLRQLAEPLRASRNPRIRDVIARLDLLKDTAVKQPFEERVRLELILATLEAKESPEQGIARTLDTYVMLEQVQDLDTKCYCLARILLDLPEIDPTNSMGFRTEVEVDLRRQFEVLIAGAADQFTVTRRLMRALAIYSMPLALDFAGQLNTVERRDRAYHEVLRAYAGVPATQLEPSLIRPILDRIEEPRRRESTLMRFIERISELRLLEEVPQIKELLTNIPTMRDPRNRCYSSAFAIAVIDRAKDGGLAKNLSEQMMSALAEVDAQWERVSLGFDLATIVSERDPELGKALLEHAREERKSSPLAEEFFADMYVGCLRLAVRAFSGLATVQPDFRDSEAQLLDLIRLVPSFSIQSRLFANLALRHHLANRTTDFRRVVETEVIPHFEACGDEEAQTESLAEIGACLFEYDPVLTLERLAALSPARADRILYGIAAYLMSRKPPGDPIDLDVLRVDLDGRVCRQVCQVLAAISEDTTISSILNRFVQALIRPDPNDDRKERCILIERDALDIANRLERITAEKFPQPKNIQHEGYAVVARAAVAKLRSAAARRVVPSLPWSRLAEEARKIPNTADRVLVLAWVGEKMFRGDSELARSLFAAAQRATPEIPDTPDRIARFSMIADSWRRVDEAESAKVLLREAMKLLRLISWDQTRDRLTGQILQAAHAVEPEFASTLVPLIENPLAEHIARLDVNARDLQRNPQRLPAEREQSPIQLQYTLGRAATRILESINSGVGHIRHAKDIGQWLVKLVDGDFDNALPVAVWFVENGLVQSRQAEVVNGIYGRVLDSLRFCAAVGRVLLGADSQRIAQPSVALPGSILTFRAPSRPQALFALGDWLAVHLQNYVKIYDPYFGPGDLELLKNIGQDVRVFVITSWKAQAGISAGDRSVERKYRDAWSRMSSQDPPWTQMTIVGTKSGDSLLHDRYIITQGGGVHLGSSIGGLGLKDSALHLLEPNDAARIEADFVDPQLAPQLQLYKGERVITHVFIL